MTLALNVLAYAGTDGILFLLNVPSGLLGMMKEYVSIIFAGIFFVFLYNYFAFLLRAVGNSVTPLWFLGGAALINIALDLVFVVRFMLWDWG